MKLLYITNGINGSGGLERVLSIKASALADDFGHEVHILTLNNQNQNTFFKFSDAIVLHDLKVGGNPIRYFKSYISGIKKMVQTIQPDCISVCDDGLKAFFLPKIIGKKIPVIYERHVSKSIEVGSNPGFKKRIITKTKFFLMNHLAKDFAKFIVLTNDNLNEWPLSNVKVIPNPLSFYPNESSSLDQKTVIAVGKQSYQKGYDRLLQSWAIIQKVCPDWQLKVYGKLEPSLGLEQQVVNLGIADSVAFLAPEKNIQAKYLASSLYVFPSRFEGFGMVLIEAMACGLPCISFDCPCGPSDIITHGEDGFLIENGNIGAFAAQMLVLMQNDSLRKEMGNTAKQNVKRYLPENIVKQWDELFKSLVK
jgi:glycosyltransferase involved in cell wall biosynthesis